MGGRYIGAYFFIPLDKRPAADDELFVKLGVQSNVHFGPMTIADRNVTVLSDHVCVQLYFLARELSDLRYVLKDEQSPLEEDPALPFACAIRDAAAATDADVVVLETHLAELDRILERYWMIILGDPDSLAAERFGLLYMSNSIVEGWTPPAGLLDRDELPDGPGRTMFAWKGRRRWF